MIKEKINIINIKRNIKKISKIIGIFILFLIAHSVWAGMTSTNYDVWLDELSSGGGHVESGLSTYSIDSNLSSTHGDPGTTTGGYYESVGFSAIDNEPTVGFNVQDTTLNFGQLSINSTAYTSHSFSAYTNSEAGYSVKVYGDPLKTSQYTLTEIGSTPSTSDTGTEQFGINLVANTVPIIGSDPGGSQVGQPATNYDVQNKFAYNEGDTIAEAQNFSYQTNFTISIVVNISEETPAGNYGTDLTYEFIPVF